MRDLKKGYMVTLLNKEELFKVFKSRDFFFYDNDRELFANLLGGKTGFVDSIEEKYKKDYFFFNLSGKNYSIPYQSVNFNIK